MDKSENPASEPEKGSEAENPASEAENGAESREPGKRAGKEPRKQARMRVMRKKQVP